MQDNRIYTVWYILRIIFKRRGLKSRAALFYNNMFSRTSLSKSTASVKSRGINFTVPNLA